MGTPSRMPFSGQLADIPPIRARTPSPVKKIRERPRTPPPVRDFEFQPSSIDVIYAEDEELFREAAIRELLKAGFIRSNIHEADNGLGALEHLARLQVTGHCTMPLVVLLDVRMPGMDGRECALQIQQLVRAKRLRREPFMMCISSIHRQVIVDEGKGNFQIVLPKPFDRALLEESLDHLRRWWTMGHGRQLAAWKSFSPSEIDVIAADDEPICRLASSVAFTQSGISPDAVVEADSLEELLEALREAQEGDASRPLIVLLGKAGWAPKLRETSNRGAAARKPFVICTSIDSDRIGNSPSAEHFHAFLPKAFGKPDVKWCLEFCCLWWLTRGDGPREEEDDEEDEADKTSDEDSA